MEYTEIKDIPSTITKSHLFLAHEQYYFTPHYWRSSWRCAANRHTPWLPCAGYTFHPREFEACVGHDTLDEHNEIYDPPERQRSI